MSVFSSSYTAPVAL